MSDTTPPPPPPGGQGPNPPSEGGGYGAPPPGGYGGYGAPPPPPGAPGGYGGYGAAPQGSNKKAVWSLVLGIIGILCCGFLTGIPAVILGKMAQKEIDATGGGQGRGMATAGFVLGIIAIALGILNIILVASGAVDLDAYTSS